LRWSAFKRAIASDWVTAIGVSINGALKHSTRLSNVGAMEGPVSDIGSDRESL
jgi:hypothetical protein